MLSKYITHFTRCKGKLSRNAEMRKLPFFFLSSRRGVRPLIARRGQFLGGVEQSVTQSGVQVEPLPGVHLDGVPEPALAEMRPLHHLTGGPNLLTQQGVGPGPALSVGRAVHQGGVGGDITGGLPRVQELFEARVPKNRAPLATATGRVRLEEDDHFFTLTIVPDDGSDEEVFDKLSKRQGLAEITVDGRRRTIRDGDTVEMGMQLMKGAADPHEVLRIRGRRGVQRT